MSGVFEGFDEAELLMLIEGELDAAQAKALEDRLEADAEEAELIERLAADRELLRSAGTPALPRDFLESVEPLLARPMLMGAPPGTYRRQHRRARRWRAAPRLAVAAVATVAAAVAVWAVFDQVLLPRLGPGEVASGPDGQGSVVVADAEESGPRGGLRPEGVMEDPASGVVHHYPPRASDLPAMASAETGEEEDAGGRGMLRFGRKAPAEFALVVEARDRSVAEAVLVQALSALEKGDRAVRTALVRNLTFDEASALAAEYRLAEAADEAGRGDEAPARAGAPEDEDGSTREAGVGEIADRAARQLERMLREAASEAGPDEVGMSGRLAGDEQLAADWEQQIRFAERGAVLTISVPVSRLQALLEQVQAAGETATRLRLLALEEEGMGEPSAAGDVAWLAARSRIERMIEQLPDDAVLLLPVVVETPAED